MIEVAPLETGFGAEISGVDLSSRPTDEDVAAIKAAWCEHGVVWFSRQPMSIDQLEAFTLALGSFGEDPFIESMPEHPHVLELRREPDEKASNFGAGWHSDWSFQAAPPSGTLLHSEVIPPVGGDTLYADTAGAYEALSAAQRERLAGLRAVHSAVLPYSNRGVYAQEKEARTMKILSSDEAEKRIAHPLVRTHPVTGRKALFISPVYTIGIEGMAREESQPILADLYTHMTQDAFVYRHHWQPDMLTLWDNRRTMHLAEGGYDGHLRVLHRTTLAGDRPV
jgi:taurine dioxygenase